MLADRNQNAEESIIIQLNGEIMKVKKGTFFFFWCIFTIISAGICFSVLFAIVFFIHLNLYNPLKHYIFLKVKKKITQLFT